jgi:hypothetical protein
MTYNANIPQTNTNLSVSQGQFLTNFSQLNTIFAKDHYTWDDNTSANRGWQKQVTFPAAIAAAAMGDMGIIHTVLGTANSQKFNTKPIPFFSNSIGDFPMMGDPLKGAGNDYSFKIGAIIFNCGFNSLVPGAPSTRTVTFNTAMSNTIFASACVFGAGNATLAISSPGNTQMTVATSTFTNSSFYYIAIGY